MQTTEQTDIAIVGGGVAGCILAIALARSYHVTIIDKLDAPAERVGECLPPAARRILKKLHLLDGFESSDAQPGQQPHLINKGSRSYWGSEQLHISDNLRNPDGFGWHLDRRAFETYLRQAAAQRGVSCRWGAKLYSSNYQDDRWTLTTKQADDMQNTDTRTIQARFVVDASGRQSVFARQVGMERAHFDKLIACWAVMPDNALNKMSTICAAESGWWYTASLPNDKRVLALHTDADLVDKRLGKDAKSFREMAMTNPQMARIIENSAAEMELKGTVAANSTRLHQVTGRQWAALGDAAMSFDPLSSQGMFNAMASAMQLADLLLESGITPEPDANKLAPWQTTYQQQADQIWAYYLKHKDIFYSQETRWKDASFWSRRINTKN